MTSAWRPLGTEGNQMCCRKRSPGTSSAWQHEGDMECVYEREIRTSPQGPRELQVCCREGCLGAGEPIVKWGRPALTETSLSEIQNGSVCSVVRNRHGFYGEGESSGVFSEVSRA